MTTDLDLHIRADSTGAQAAFRDAGGSAHDLGEEVGKSAEKWHLLVEGITEAVKKVGEFALESVKAYAETQRVQLQLTRAAGEYSGALKEQADALSKIYAVDNDVIMRGQILLAQWGGAGAATEEVTKATLNLAAAMGTDLSGATQMLIRNVESGGVSLAKMGVHFEQTGDKGKDLAAAVEAINRKFGGAAGANADSLIGRMAAAGIAFEEVKKGVGHDITTFLDWTGAIGGTTKALQALSEFISQDEQRHSEEAQFKAGEKALALKELANAQGIMSEAATSGEVSPTILKMFLEDVDRAQAKVNALLADEKKLVLPEVTGETNKKVKEDAAAAKAAAAKAAESAAVEHAKKMQEIQDKNVRDFKEYQHGIEEIDLHAEELDKKAADASVKRIEQNQKEFEKIMEAQDKQVEKDRETVAKFFKDTNDANIKATEEQIKKWEEVGAQTGAAFVNALGTQLEKLAKGGEFDVSAFMADVLGAVIGTAGSILSVAFPAAAPLISAVGNLANIGIHAGFGAMSAKNHTKTFHEGGWVEGDIDLPRYHSGTWISADEQRAILQTGERVLSRREVGSMGGPSGVDQAARGGSGARPLSVTIHAIDAKSAADSFASELGRGLRQALRSGRGDLPSVLGIGPR